MQATVGFVSSDALRHSLTTFHLYVLRDPDTNAVRYVGCCINPTARMNSHRNVHFWTPKFVRRWIERLKREGKRPVMQVLETRVGKTVAYRRERQLIGEWFEKIGHDLLNHIGVSGFVPVEALEKRAAALRYKIDRREAVRAECAEYRNAARERYCRRYGYGLNGVWKMPIEWARDLGISSAAMYARLRNWPIEKALTTPKQN